MIGSGSRLQVDGGAAHKQTRLARSSTMVAGDDSDGVCLGQRRRRPGALLHRTLEKGTSLPVPLVELRTTHNVRFVTDNAGLIAFDLPELIGRETWFFVVGHGYEIPRDGLGFQGLRLIPQPGKTLKVEVNRTIIARRLGRVTGAGLFGESQKLGEALDWREPGVLAATAYRTRSIRSACSGFGGILS